MSSAIEPDPAMMTSVSQLPSGTERLAPTSTICRCALNLPLSERTGDTTIGCFSSQKVRFDAYPLRRPLRSAAIFILCYGTTNSCNTTVSISIHELLPSTQHEWYSSRRALRESSQGEILQCFGLSL